MTVKIIGRLTDEGETVLLSLYSDRVKAGFPSPATDYVQNRIDLNTLLIHSPTTTYLVEVEGDSMIDMGIYPNDILIVDRSLSARHKDIVIALVDDGFTAKQLILGEHIILRAHNENYADIVVKGSLELFGVVVSSVRRFKR
ncbi:translesion error-prone DNA polymerase V autoproteolytic subunit [uncultured Psychrobacter sp.]|jgi:DNA polymerase V|uniref:LexA family protein n=1 Tax=uncultured Psychrobacter sp. TaxID=259303 RepID=UPI002637F4BA|nr:translesion error-prone DNA polymerase V autoproteolytic subunit [uncultured Psychrobacter sp.]|tara:strand:+ start:806 stop:1231 length:426 start_codon:yes stop_codon:yes gene_type:complete